jgi:L-asparaginase
MPEVAVGSLGGTITMTSRPGESGVVPGLRADDLMAAVPGLDAVAQVRATTLRTVPGASLTFADLLEALRWAREEVDSGAAGAVLVQGTDTLEETAYLLDLFWDRPQPLVLTGAMRPPQQAGADGPANLLAAVATAAAPVAAGVGGVVVLNDEVHAAARVRKTDSTAVHAFSSPGTGPLGRIVEGELVLTGRSDRAEPLPVPDAEVDARVALLESHLGDDGGLLRLVLDAAYDGVVLGAFGVGHVSAVAAEVVSEAVRQIPVVVASRTGTGSTLTSMYGFPGSESDLLRRGAVMAGWLDPRKARLLLTVLLMLGYADRDIAAEFARRGRP